MSTNVTKNAKNQQQQPNTVHGINHHKNKKNFFNPPFVAVNWSFIYMSESVRSTPARVARSSCSYDYIVIIPVPYSVSNKYIIVCIISWLCAICQDLCHFKPAHRIYYVLAARKTATVKKMNQRKRKYTLGNVTRQSCIMASSWMTSDSQWDIELPAKWEKSAHEIRTDQRNSPDKHIIRIDRKQCTAIPHWTLSRWDDNGTFLKWN